MLMIIVGSLNIWKEELKSMHINLFVYSCIHSSLYPLVGKSGSLCGQGLPYG